MTKSKFKERAELHKKLALPKDLTKKITWELHCMMLKRKVEVGSEE